MLSIENPPSSDPSCPCEEIPQLKKSCNSSHGSDDDDDNININRASHKLALPEVVVAPDLSKDHNNTPLPKFSIRDYVFTARSKDIKKNWPFSLKNLQLCLKHGVKDVLPPFGSTDHTARNRSFGSEIARENCLSKIGDPKLVDDASDRLARDTSDDVGLNRKLVDPCKYGISSCRSGGENDFPSTTTSVSLSEIESVAANKLSSPQSEVDTSLEPLVEVQAAGPPVYPSQKNENTTRVQGKKCRLIVKFGGNFERSSTEDIASNTTTVSETMASKVCPVCKTFSSSSNTTLNAHIDQCLSGESTPKWTSDFKLSRHRIKPRKTRLMVDVYATAKRCTLEELDRRNGTNWATISSLPCQNNNTGILVAEGRKQRVSQVHPEESADVGAVYIDSSGTKVRILSKLCDVPMVSKGEDVERRKPLKGGKVHKLFKKKTKHVQKHQKYLKLTPQSKKLRSYHKAQKSQVNGDQEKVVATDDSEKNKIQTFKSFEHAKPSDRGTLGQWVCSKRTGLARKVKSKDGHQPLRCELHVARDLIMESTDRPILGDSLVDRSLGQKLANSSENANSFAEVSDRMESSSYEACDSERQWSPGRKRMRSPLVVPRINRDAERAFSSMKQKTDHTMSIREGHKWKSPSYVCDRPSLVSNNDVETHAGSHNNSDTSPRASTKPYRSCYGFPSKAMRLSSLRKKVSSLSQSPGTESKFNTIKKSSACMKSQVHVVAEMNKEVVAWHSEVNQRQEMMQICTVNRSGREYVSDEDSLDRSISISQREEAMFHDSSDGDSDDSSSKYNSIEFGKRADQTHGEDTIADDSTSKVAVGDSFACLSKSLDTEFHKARNCMEIQSNTLQPIEDYDVSLCRAEMGTGTNEPSFGDEPVMFSADEVGNGMNVRSSQGGTELNCEVEQGNSFLEVEPISIPGPPGSFLPSPGGDDSSEEDFQGNSSLTTSRFHSSQEQHELVNRGSSDSPISATSSISNSTAARFDVNYTEPLSAEPCTGTDKFGSGSQGIDVEPSIENACIVSPITSTAVERFTVEGESLKVNKMPTEKGRLNFRNEDQPCCCSRKERVTQATTSNYEEPLVSRKERITQVAALNHEEPQLLRRRTMAAVTVPAVGKQMNENLNSRLDHVDIVRPDSFPLSSCRSSGSENVFSPPGPFPLQGAPSEFSGRGDSELASPSGSNPVLRLMGKNLMVVNKDEDTSTTAQLPAQSSAQNNHHQFPPFPGIYTTGNNNIRNPDYNSCFQPFMNQGLVNFSQDPHNCVGQSLDVRTPSGLRNHQYGFQSTLQAPANFNQHIGGSFAVYPERHVRPNAVGASMYNLEKVDSTASRRHKNKAAASNGAKEIIIIDDGTEGEAAGLTSSTARKQVEGSREGRLVSSYGVPSIAYGNAFSPYYHQAHGESTTLMQGVQIHATRRGAPANTSPVSMVQQQQQRTGPYYSRGGGGAVAAAPTHLRSAGIYYSPSLS